MPTCQHDALDRTNHELVQTATLGWRDCENELGNMVMGSENLTEDDSFAALLRGHRGRLRMSQEELAFLSRLSVQGISLLELGKRKTPQAATVQKLADALKLTDTDRRRFVAAARGVQADIVQAAKPMTGIAPEPSPYFAGRADALATLQRKLAQVRRVSIHGPAGVGKTQLVVQYLRRYAGPYTEGVYWLVADRESTFVGDLAGLARQLDLPERNRPEQLRQIETVVQWLRERKDWLLVIDNVAPPLHDVVRQRLGSLLDGFVVTTSRSPVWPPGLGLEPLPLGVSTRFLLDRTGQADEEAAVSLAEELGGLPLALEQAAAYMEASGRDLADYRELFRVRPLELMRENKPDDYPQPLATVLELTIEAVRQDDALAADLLRLCACLAPDDIPISMLTASAPGGGLGGALEDEIQFDRTVTVLRRYSLVERHPDGLRMHRLVQTVLLASMDVGQRQRWLGAATRLLSVAWPGGAQEHPEAWGRCDRLLAHVHRVDGLTSDAAGESGELAGVLDMAGCYLWARGQHAQAESLLRRALSIRERVLGPEHPDTAESLNNMAVLFRARGDLNRAVELHRRALGIREGAFGAEHAATAESMNNLALVLRTLGEFSEAHCLLECALAVRERVLGPDHPHTAATLNNLALLRRSQGQLRLAMPLMERALAFNERSMGSDHPNTVSSLNNLALLLHDLGMLPQARRLHERVLAIRENVLGPNHPHTADTLVHLAIVLLDSGEPQTAKLLLQRALAVDLQVFGKDHLRTARSMAGLARALLEMGEIDAAKRYGEGALTVRQKLLGSHHPDVGGSLADQGWLWYADGDSATARSLLERAVAVMEGTVGPRHFLTGRCQYKLAVVLRCCGDELAAAELLERAVVVLGEALGTEHRWTIESVRMLRELCDQKPSNR